MAEIKQAVVYLYLNDGPVPAGILNTHVDGRNTSSEFVYGKKYILRHNAVAVDPVELPLPAPGETVIYATPENFSIFNGIRDASPDNWGRYLLDKKFPQKGLDEFDYVAASGNDRVGALAFGESVTSGVGIWNTESFTQPPDDNKYLDLAEIQTALDNADDPANPYFQKLLDYGPSIGGARPKGTVVWKGSLHLAKFSLASDTINICLAEYATMLLAKKCGINTPEVSLSSVEGKSVFLIERFDRVVDGEKLDGSRIPFHSALTMTGTHEADYGRHAYWDIVEAITRYSSDASRDRNELFRRMVFNIFCNNSDDHMRNHGFLYAGNGQWRLSPAYDIVPFPQSTETYALALHVGEAGRVSTVENALSAISRFGLKQQEAEQIVEEVREGTMEWDVFFAECGAEREDLDRLSSCFRKL
jgi:serine/threonine-protein kinase HipA